MAIKSFTLTDQKAICGINPDIVQEILHANNIKGCAKEFLRYLRKDIKHNEVLILVDLKQPHLSNTQAFCLSEMSFIEDSKQKPTRMLCILKPNDKIDIKLIKILEYEYKSTNRFWSWDEERFILRTNHCFGGEIVNRNFTLSDNTLITTEVYSHQLFLPIFPYRAV